MFRGLDSQIAAHTLRHFRPSISAFVALPSFVRSPAHTRFLVALSALLQFAHLNTTFFSFTPVGQFLFVHSFNAQSMECL
jgi:hypothetical protein